MSDLNELVEELLACLGETSEEATLTITYVAAKVQVHPNTLRNYERDGLLTPKRCSRGRRYSQQHLRQALLIQRLSSLGLSPTGIQLVLLLATRDLASR